ncbi:Amino acid/amide ABC transporter substrate-binding protein, HAAT family [Syntrophobacter sp. SbD1]|nr:Amino acid/amide ABC transporter substrate-binding protein, HAAT family [Syntrophobacter sp. SbD1]
MKRVFAALALILGLTGIYSSAQASPKEAKIGFAFSMTGGAAAYGDMQKKGVQLAVDEINAQAGQDGIKIAPFFDDDASMPQQGVNVFNRFIAADKVVMIIGPTLSNTAQVTDRIAQQSGVPVLGVSNTAKGITDIGDYIFRDSLTEMVVIPNTIRVAKEKLGIKKVAVLYGNDDAFTKGGYDAFKKALGDSNIQILSEQTFAKGDRDFAPQLTQIRSIDPDALIVSALVEEASGIVSQARRLGIAESVSIIGGNGLNSPALMKNAGKAAEKVIVGAAWNAASTNPLNRKFVEAFTAKYGSPPDQFAAQAYAAVYIAREALGRAGSTDNRKAVRDALAQIKGLDTVLGKFSFTEGRDADHAPVVQVVKEGKFEVFGE